jgi:hypothetical protein
MNSIDRDSTGASEVADTSVREAEPYRTPASVPDETRHRGLWRSPIAWGLATAAVLGGVGLFMSRRATDKGVINYVEDFGLERRMPIEPIEFEEEEYETTMQASEAIGPPGAVAGP